MPPLGDGVAFSWRSVWSIYSFATSEWNGAPNSAGASVGCLLNSWLHSVLSDSERQSGTVVDAAYRPGGLIAGWDTHQSD